MSLEIGLPPLPEPAIRYDRENEGQLRRTLERVLKEIIARSVSHEEAIEGAITVSGEWKFDTVTTAADPGVRKFRFNNATLASVTAIYIDDVSDNGFDIHTLAGFLDSGNRIYVQQKDDATKAALFELSAAPTDNTGWWTFAVTVVASGTLPDHNAVCTFHFSLGGGGGGGLTSPVAIADGGTGQTSKTPAFDALAPTTTKGDLIAHDGTDNVRLPVGAVTRQFLITDPSATTGLKWESADVSGGGGLVLLDEQSPSAVTQVDLVTGFADDYDTYEVHYDIKMGTDGDVLALRTSTDGGSSFDAGASDYVRASFGNDSGTAAPAGQSDTADSEVDISTAIGNAANEYGTGRITCYGFRSSARYKLFHAFSVGVTDTAASQQRIRHGYRASATVANGIRLFSLLGGTITGTVRLYGVAHQITAESAGYGSEHAGTTNLTVYYGANWAGAQTLSTIVLGTASLVRMMPFIAPARGGTLDRLAFEVTTVGGAGAKVRIGLYDSIGVNDIHPNALLEDSGLIDTTSGGGAAPVVKTYTVNRVLVPGRIYWLAVIGNNVSTTIRAITTQGTGPILGHSGGTGTTAVSSMVTYAAAVDGASAAFDDPAPPVDRSTGINPPLLLYRFSA